MHTCNSFRSVSVGKFIVGIDHVFASGAVVGRATTHEWGRPSLRAQRGAGRPHGYIVVEWLLDTSSPPLLPSIHCTMTEHTWKASSTMIVQWLSRHDGISSMNWLQENSVYLILNAIHHSWHIALLFRQGLVSRGGLVLDDGYMGPISLGQTLWVSECTVVIWNAAFKWYSSSLNSYMTFHTFGLSRDRIKE